MSRQLNNAVNLTTDMSSYCATASASDRNKAMFFVRAEKYSTERALFIETCRKSDFPVEKYIFLETFHSA